MAAARLPGAAKQDAEQALDFFENGASEGWDELVEQVCYGQLVGAVIETARRPREAGDCVDSAIDTIVEYELRDLPPYS